MTPITRASLTAEGHDVTPLSDRQVQYAIDRLTALFERHPDPLTTQERFQIVREQLEAARHQRHLKD